jgi:hypothetical protein
MLNYYVVEVVWVVVYVLIVFLQVLEEELYVEFVQLFSFEYFEIELRKIKY